MSGLNDSSNTNENTNADEEDYDEDDDSWYYYIKQSIKKQIYNLSGIERLKIQPKKPK
jgi:hypothetical protein